MNSWIEYNNYRECAYAKEKGKKRPSEVTEE